MYTFHSYKNIASGGYDRINAKAIRLCGVVFLEDYLDKNSTRHAKCGLDYLFCIDYVFCCFNKWMSYKFLSGG